MDQETVINEIVARAAVNRVSIVEACKRAGIAPSTFYRWRDGAEAGMRKMAALKAAVDDMCREKAA